MIIVASGFRTIEGPTAFPDGSLYFSDVRGGGVHRLSPEGVVGLVIPRRKGVGGLCTHELGGIVVSGRDLCHVKDGVSRIIFSRDDVETQSGLTLGGFRDIGAGPAGRICAWSQRFTSAGDYGPVLLAMVTGEHLGDV